MYENILVPTDGSEQASEATPHALDLAENYDATVHALCVVNRAATRQLSPTRAETTMGAMVEEAERATSEIEDEMEKAGVECLSVV
ncbi:MAG: universal stress protein, partial [Euryarchaeota archaeon]|nr:universal stress protein [Euryarchaeota archaeon]